MSVFRSSNPFLKTEAFDDRRGGLDRFGDTPIARPGTMTVQGTVNVSFILVGLTIAAAVFCWSFLQNNPGMLFGGAAISSILTLVLTFVAYFKPQASPFIAPVLALGEGVFVGALSVFWTRYADNSQSGTVQALGPGLVLQAGVLTLGVTGGLLVAYTTRLIRPSQRFLRGVVAATFGLCLFSVVALVLSMFGIHIPYIWDNGPIGIAFSGFIVVLAAMNLLVDFDFIEQGARNGAPKYMEWYAGIGLLVTVVWLYVSILRLLAQLQRRN